MASDSSSIYDHWSDSDSVASVAESCKSDGTVLLGSHKWTLLFIDREHNTPLQNALAKRNDYEIESLLRSSTTDIEVVDDHGNTPLMKALIMRFYSAVDLLLNKEVNVNAKNCGDKTPLHFAVLEGNEKYITLLIEKGADVNSKDRLGKTPLRSAVEINSELAVKLLLANRCDVNVLDKHGGSPLHNALKRKFWKIAAILLANGCNLAQQNQRGETPLHKAAYKGKLDYKNILDGESSISTQVNVDKSPSVEASVNDYVSMCKLLLANDGEESSKIVNIKNNRGQTALHIAAESYRSIDDNVIEQIQFYAAIQQGYKEFCNILLSKGALVNDRDNDGNSPIHTAVVAANTELLRIMLDSGADVNCLNKYGETALQIAFGDGKNFEEKCRMLVGCGANVNVYDKYKLTPLHAAVRRDEEDNLWQFLVDNGADVYARDSCGNSPLHIIAESGSLRYLRDMLYSYPNVNHKNNKGKTALHIAATSFKDAEQKCKLLIGAGADVTVKDNFSRTPLHFAALNRLCSVCELLIAKGAVVDAIDYYEKAPIHLAVKSRDLEVLKCILDNGAETNQKDRRGKTSLHGAIGSFTESEEMCKLLLDRGADVTARDNDYQTPLHLATEWSSLDVVDLLLEAGAEVNAQDRNGKTPLHMLDNRISNKSIMYLRDHTADTVKCMLEWGALGTLTDKRGITALSFSLSILPSFKWDRTPSVIIDHILKCKCAKLYTDLECTPLPDISCRDFEISCSKELTVMKNTMVGQHSLLDVFSLYSDPIYLSNCELKATLVSHEILQFPIYKSLLKSTFRRAQERVKLFYKAQDFLKWPLPNEINRKILSYLRDYDLHNIIKAKELCN